MAESQGDPSREESQDEYHELSRHMRELARRLVHDDSSADDVVQEAWLAALDQPRDQVRNLNAWLAQVVHNLARRSHARESRRRDLEQLAREPGLASDSAAEAERRSTGELLRTAIEELEQPYRGVVTLRYLEEVSVKDIAERRGNSPATVRSQLSRGLDRLREILDRRHAGDRGAWCGMVIAALRGSPRGDVQHSAPLPAPGAAPAAALRSTGWILLFTSVTTLALWRPWDRGRAEEQLAQAPAPAVDLPDETDRDAVAARDIEDPGRTRLSTAPQTTEDAALTPAPPASTRLLEIDVRHADGSAAERVFGIAQGARGPLHVSGEGQLRIELAPEDLLSAPVIPGPDGGVTVMVRPEGGAWSFAHSIPVPREGRQLELRSRGPGLTLAGHVEDEFGEPVEGAMIVMRPTMRGNRTDAAGLVFGETPLEAYSDAAGNYALEGLPRTRHRIVVSAPGLVPLRRTLGDEESARVTEDFTLRFGAVVAGSVRNPDGSPVPEARVWQPDYGTRDEHGQLPGTTAIEGGAYELTGLEPGRHRLWAVHPNRPELCAEAVLEIPAEGVVYWDPQLAPAQGLRARVVDENGQPLARASVLLFITESEPAWGDLRTSSDDGGVHFPHVPNVDDLALVAGRSSAMVGLENLRGVRPGTHVYTIRLDGEREGGTLVGRLLDAGGVPLRDAFLTCQSQHASMDFACDPTGGQFEEHGLQPGSYELWAHAPGRGAFPLGRHEVVGGERLELGDHRAPPTGHVDLHWSLPPTADRAWVLQTKRPEGCPVPEKDLLLLVEDPGELELFAGRYRLIPSAALRSPGAGEVRTVPFEVREGTRTRVEAP